MCLFDRPTVIKCVETPPTSKFPFVQEPVQSINVAIVSCSGNAFKDMVNTRARIDKKNLHTLFYKPTSISKQPDNTTTTIVCTNCNNTATGSLNTSSDIGIIGATFNPDKDHLPEGLNDMTTVSLSAKAKVCRNCILATRRNTNKYISNVYDYITEDEVHVFNMPRKVVYKYHNIILPNISEAAAVVDDTKFSTYDKLKEYLSKKSNTKDSYYPYYKKLFEAFKTLCTMQYIVFDETEVPAPEESTSLFPSTIPSTSINLMQSYFQKTLFETYSPPRFSYVHKGVTMRDAITVVGRVFPSMLTFSEMLNLRENRVTYDYSASFTLTRRDDSSVDKKSDYAPPVVPSHIDDIVPGVTPLPVVSFTLRDDEIGASSLSTSLAAKIRFNAVEHKFVEH